MHVEDSNGQVTKGCCDSADSENPKERIWETVEKGIERTMLNPNIIPVDFAVGGLTPLDEIPTIDLSPLTRSLERSALHEHLLKNVEAKVLDPLDIPRQMGALRYGPVPSGRYSASCIQCTTAT